MININFDNAYYLLIAIPLVLLIVIPYVITINKENRTKAIVTTLVLHLCMAICVTLAAAGLEITAVITKTEVYVVADVSYSADRNLDTVDQYIENVSKNLPDNSKLGVVCFGKDQQLLTELGKKKTSVKNAVIDDSATDIAAALNYTAGLFSNDAIKHIVLITDGKQTAGNGASDFIAAVQSLDEQNVYIDAMYVNDNIPSDVDEVQISAVDYPSATYLGKDSSVDVMLYSNSAEPAQGFLRLYLDGEEKSVKAITLTRGYNLVSFSLPTDKADIFHYEVKVETDADTSAYNDSFMFTQTVSDSVKVLLVTKDSTEETAVRNMFDEKLQVEIDTYGSADVRKFECENCHYVCTTENNKIPTDACPECNEEGHFVRRPDMFVPCTIEQVCKYDEIIISNINILELENYTAFVTSVGDAVSKFGKSLTTFGNLDIQNKDGETAEELSVLEEMLPVTFSNIDREEKMMGLVIDASRSMDMAGRLLMAKSAAKQILALLEDGDWVSIISFSGNSYSHQSPIEITAENREQLAGIIDSITTKQGTYIGSGMSAMYNKLKEYTNILNDIEVMLLSDGASFTAESENPQAVAKKMRLDGIHTSCINTGNSGNETATSLLKEIRLFGAGHYYEVNSLADVDNLVMSEIADDIMETIVEKQSPVLISSKKDGLVKGIESFSPVNGYVNGKEKNSATLVLSTLYSQDFSDETTAEKEVPLCAYWHYGYGRVTTFTSMLTGAWVEDFQDENGLQFLKNLFNAGVPEEAHEYPFQVMLSEENSRVNVMLTPSTIKSGGQATGAILRPDGTEETLSMAFNGAYYTGIFYATEVGSYTLKLAYSYDGNTYETVQYYAVSYLPEYNAFTTYDASDLHNAIRNYGVVSEDGKLVVTNDENEVMKYVISCAMPLMIFVAVLFIVDIVIRKLKWSDIVSLFSKSKAKGGKP